jgi:hypothetical protein
MEPSGRAFGVPKDKIRAIRVTVIASASEAIHGTAGGSMDCFVADAPRNDG